MKQNFTCHLKTTILAIIFLLSGGIPANSQYLYLADKNNNNGSSYDNKTDVSGYNLHSILYMETNKVPVM